MDIELTISQKNRDAENAIFKQIQESIDTNTSFVFDAGAGAGKTYTLIQSLRHILLKYGNSLKTHNQKVRCVTYTNVAAQEIKDRLGNTNLVIVSTIHDFLWEEIKKYQRELVDIHKITLNEKIDVLSSSLQTEAFAQRYRDIPHADAFKQNLIQNREVYYENKNLKSADFKAAVSKIMQDYPDMLNNVTNFRQVADSILKIHDYKQTIRCIENKQTSGRDNKIDYTKVLYNPRINSDRLASMEFSHDTLLEYAETIINTYDVLQKIISDKYPYILIDEYQDTHAIVIKIMSALSKKSIIGYYGDKRQSIYEKGVGANLRDIHPNINIIQKTYNRRSAPQVISAGNAIRSDGLIQQTIYDNFPDGAVSFYTGNDNDIERFIEYHKDKWGVTKQNYIACLSLRNEDVANRSGFGNVYAFFQQAPWYRQNTRYLLLRDHILDKEHEKLGRVQLLLFNILDFFYKTKNPNTLVKSLIKNKSLLNTLNISNVQKLKTSFQKIKGNNIIEYVDSMFDIARNDGREIAECIKYFLDNDDINSGKDLVNYIVNELFLVDDKSTYEECVPMVRNFLENNFAQLQTWYSYLMEAEQGTVKYYTCHGTKGLEFDNVILIFGSKFGRNQHYFSNLITHLNNSPIDTGDECAARNLLYVSVTRARNNLAVLYTDELTDEQKEQLSIAFGSVNKFDTVS